jgi:hypothetical protein
MVHIEEVLFSLYDPQNTDILDQELTSYSFFPIPSDIL